MSERVAVVSTSYPKQPGDAAGHFVESEVKRLVRAGCDVHVVVPGRGPRARDGATLHWLDDHGAFGWPGALTRLRERPQRSLGACAFVWRAQRALAQLGPLARVQAHFLVPSAWPIATLALRGKQTPRLEIVGHGSDVRLFCALPAALRAPIARAWLSRGAELRLVSDDLAEQLRRATPELAPQICVANSPMDLPAVPTRAAARVALGIEASARLALVVSRLVPAKRVSMALAALSLLDQLTVVVVGDGPELSGLQARFPRVRFTGLVPRETALCFMAAADVLVSASAEEGAPSVVREARALGLPVVARAAGDLAAWAAKDPGLLVL